MQNLLSNLYRMLQQQGLTHAAFLLAYSGGLDSTALLSLFAQLKQQLPQLQLRAIHIHHGLSPNADHWAQHCQQQSEQFHIPLVIEKVRLDPKKSLEDAAREARYQAFKRHLNDNEILVTAHHLNDQSETLLLALKRGSGVKGLAAMQVRSELWQMPIFRPLLPYSREQLAQYVATQHLTWIEDESNQDDRYDRNFLRNRILPELRRRWTAIDRTLQRSAQHCYEQQQLIDELLQPLFEQLYCRQNRTLDIRQFADYSRPKQNALLRLWLSQSAVAMPSQPQLEQLIEQVIFARYDSQPQLALVETVIRRYQQRLYLTEHYADLSQRIIEVAVGKNIRLPDNLGEVRFEPQADGLKVIWRQNQERIFALPLPENGENIQLRFHYAGKVRLAANRANQEIKKIWQQADIPPWQRQRTPLVFYGDEFISALGVFITHRK